MVGGRAGSMVMGGAGASHGERAAMAMVASLDTTGYHVDITWISLDTTWIITGHYVDITGYHSDYQPDITGYQPATNLRTYVRT